MDRNLQARNFNCAIFLLAPLILWLSGSGQVWAQGSRQNPKTSEDQPLSFDEAVSGLRNPSSFLPQPHSSVEVSPPLTPAFEQQRGSDPFVSDSPFVNEGDSIPARTIPERAFSRPTKLPLKPGLRPPTPGGTGNFTKAQSFVKNLSVTDASFQAIVGQARILTLSQDLAEPGKNEPLVAVGDETVVQVDLIGPRQVRILGLRSGITDLTFVTADGEIITYEIHSLPDLDLISMRVKEAFPSAQVDIRPVRQHVVLEGQARDSRQAAQIAEMVRLAIVPENVERQSRQAGAASLAPPPVEQGQSQEEPAVEQQGPIGDEEGQRRRGDVYGDPNRLPQGQVESAAPQVINLLKVPGPQQVMLKVRVAELNRTAIRELGVSYLHDDGENIIGHNLAGLLAGAVPGNATAFAILDNGEENLFLNALRRNNVFRILAEPTLVAMNGQEAQFLSGGEFPVPVPQTGAGNVGSAITIEYKDFGVGVGFVPYIQDEGVIRLAVSPEVSSLDFSAGVAVGGTEVPGLNTRRTRTTVELREGQTLAISGLLQQELQGSTDRIPGLGDLPYIGSFFRNNSIRKLEKELVVLVTPHLVEPMEPDQVTPLPGDHVCEPDDLEFYLLGRIEGRGGKHFRSTTRWDDPFGLEHRRRIETSAVHGPIGYSR